MKEKLDVIWNDSRIACPNHLVRWNTKGNGYSVWGKIGIYFTKGTLRRPKIKKIKGKGYSWLMKGYVADPLSDPNSYKGAKGPNDN